MGLWDYGIIFSWYVLFEQTRIFKKTNKGYEESLKKRKEQQRISKRDCSFFFKKRYSFFLIKE